MVARRAGVGRSRHLRRRRLWLRRRSPLRSSRRRLRSPGRRHGADDPTGRPEEDIASTGFRKLDQDPVVVRKDQIAEGSDLAFRGRLMISGSYDGIGLFERKRQLARADLLPPLPRRPGRRHSFRRLRLRLDRLAQLERPRIKDLQQHANRRLRLLAREGGPADRRHFEPAQADPGWLHRDRVRLAHADTRAGRASAATSTSSPIR